MLDAEWRQRAVGLDYHVEVDKHYYSVPYALLREQVWVRITARTVEVFHRGARVAAHARTRRTGSTPPARPHAVEPSAPCRLDAGEAARQAAGIGPGTLTLVEVILRERTHPEQGFRSCLGILPARTHGRDRLEAACTRALEIGARSYTSVNSILRNNLDRRRPEDAADGPAITHLNIRGAGYFH